MAFAELAAKSHFSFLEGASAAEEMVNQAKCLGLEAIGLCDRDGIYGMVRAHAEAKKIGQKLIVGAELTLDPREETDGEAGPNDWVLPERVLLLVESVEGYSHLCRALTIAHADHEKGTASISMREIAEQNEGLVLLIPDLHAPPSISLDWTRVDPFYEFVKAFEDRVAIAVTRRLDGGDEARMRAAEMLEKRYGFDVVATSRPLFHRAQQKPLADILHCIKNKTTLDSAGQALTSNAEAKLKSAREMESLFRDRLEWVRATLPFAERCTFSMSQIAVRFPSDELLGPGETADMMLRRVTYKGARTRYPSGIPKGVEAQIEKELTLIAKIKVAPFFLSVWDVVEMARKRRILCQGRGSAANSAVCFALGITAIDPMRSSLLFERFLSAERNEPPDIDVDFEHERREEVIQDIYEKYGRDRSAMVSEVIAYRGKSALKEVGKAFGLSLDQVEQLSQVVLRYDLSEVTTERIAEVGLDPNDPRIMSAIALAKRLEGFPRHLSIHVGGFVLSADSLDKVAPIEPARMEGRTVIPWDKDDLDALGFFKMDVLALGMLTAIRKCLELIHPSKIDPIDTFAAIPGEDPVVYDAICHADTVGVFQIESRAQMSMLPRLKPRKFYDLVIEVAIVRPGPIQGGMVHPYLRRRNGEEPSDPPHPCLGEILDRTLGVPLFQEQVMQISMVGAGYTPGEADQLRRDMAAWKKHGRLERHRDRLIKGFRERGVPVSLGERLYKQIQGFGEYGFPESHAASFALLVYASAWLKVHHQAAFTCALLNSQPMGFYSTSSLVKDAQRHGVRVRPVCVVASNWDHTLEEDPESAGSLALRLGMRLVSGIGESAVKSIVDTRAASPFSSVMDVVTRANLKKNEIEALAEAGALERLVPERREALWEAHAPRLGGLFQRVDLEAGQPHGYGDSRRSRGQRFRPLEPVEQLLLDYGRTGLSIDDHPMCYVRPHIAHRRVTRARELESTAHGTSVRVAGLVLGRQRPMTASGVTFVTLEDETGIMNLIVMASVFEAHRHAALHAKILFVTGKVEREGEVIHVLVKTIERLELPKGQTIDARSRDFR